MLRAYGELLIYIYSIRIKGDSGEDEVIFFVERPGSGGTDSLI